MAFKYDEIVVKWHNSNKEHYKSKGYNFIKNGKEFNIKIEDMMPRSEMKVDLCCDLCGEEFSRSYVRIISYREKYNKLDLCYNCTQKRKTENKVSFVNNREKRLSYIKDYIDKNNSLKYFNVSKNYGALRSALSINNENLQDEIEKMGYDYYKLMYKKPSKYYDDLNNYRYIIDDFILKHKRFPTNDEAFVELGLSALRGRGVTIVDLKKMMNYYDKEDLLDDLGYKNKSSQEYIISQFLIKNKVSYKRDVNITNDRKYNCDWVIYDSYGNDVVWVEYWGGYENKPKRINSKFKNYNNIHDKKMRLYKKNKKNLISIYPDDFQRLKYNNKIKFMETIFDDYIIFKRDVEIENIIPPNKMSDDEIFKCMMKYSDNEDLLPTTTVLRENGVYGIYEEMSKRYESYQSFAEKYGKNTYQKFKNYWSKEKIFEKFNYIIKKYGEIPMLKDISKMQKTDMNLRGIHCQFLKFGGYTNLLEEFNSIN